MSCALEGIFQFYETDQKIKRLRLLINEGDADITAGRVTEYASAGELANSILKHGDAH